MDEELLWWVNMGGNPLSDLCWEEALLDAAARGSPGFFTYSWSRPALVVGYGQRDLSPIDLEVCRGEGVAVLRRCSGGTGVLHQGDLSFALALPASHALAAGIGTLYDRLLLAVQSALGGFDVTAERPVRSPQDKTPPSPICFEGRGIETLLHGGRKILGCAQVRRRSSILVHGTLLFHLDAHLQSRVFRVPAARIEASVGPLPPRPGLDPAAFGPRLAEAMSLATSMRLVPAGEPPPAAPACLERAADPFWCPVSG